VRADSSCCSVVSQQESFIFISGQTIFHVKVV
jgi:hypothetical protein